MEKKSWPQMIVRSFKNLGILPGVWIEDLWLKDSVAVSPEQMGSTNSSLNSFFVNPEIDVEKIWMKQMFTDCIGTVAVKVDQKLIWA